MGRGAYHLGCCGGVAAGKRVWMVMASMQRELWVGRFKCVCWTVSLSDECRFEPQEVERSGSRVVVLSSCSRWSSRAINDSLGGSRGRVGSSPS